MAMDMPDSRLNEAEHDVQPSFMKSLFFNSLLMSGLVLGAYLTMHDLPDRAPRPRVTTAVHYEAVGLAPASGQLRLSGAWRVEADEPRLGGLSALAIDRGRFVAVSDLGAAVVFDSPSAAAPRAILSDLGEGPGPPGFKKSRDAEALVRDRVGKGWLVAFEQHHSLWRYDQNFANGARVADLDRPDWKRNRGIEGMLVDAGGVLLAAENGREAMRIDRLGVRRIAWAAGTEVADASSAPDGSHWLLLRGKGVRGISQAIAPLVPTLAGYRIGRKMALPKAPFDNYEGMAIAARPGGGWRFWLVTDDGHRVMARTLLVALDFDPQKQTPGGKHRASDLRQSQ